MAQARTRPPSETVSAPTGPTPPPTPSNGDVVEALLHLARLAAAHHRLGAVFVYGKTGSVDEPDEEAAAALAKATHILLKDRDRMRGTMADALIARVHAVVKGVFKNAKDDPEADLQTEDVVEERLRDWLGLSLTPFQKKQFAIDRTYIKTQRGASLAAADAIGAAFELRTGRSIFGARANAGRRPPIPGPLNRWVPLRMVRQFVAQVFDGVEERRRGLPILPLDVLRSNDHAEELTALVEACFKEEACTLLDRQRPKLVAACFAVLRGGEPVFDPKLQPAAQKVWLRFRATLAPAGKQLATEPSAGDQGAPVTQDRTEELRECAAKAADVLIAQLKKELNDQG